MAVDESSINVLSNSLSQSRSSLL